MAIKAETKDGSKSIIVMCFILNISAWKAHWYSREFLSESIWCLSQQSVEDYCGWRSVDELFDFYLRASSN